MTHIWCTGALAGSLLYAVVATGGLAEIDTIEATLTQDSDICDGEAECESLSLRQLRGELTSSMLAAPEESAETEDKDVTEDAADEAGEPEDDADQPAFRENMTSCTASWQHCTDWMEYGTRQECADDPVCEVLDSGDYGGEKGEAWFCKTAVDSCMLQEPDLADFRAKDAVPEELLNVTLDGAVAWHHHQSYHSSSVGGATYTLYHTTSKAAAQAIVRTGFRPGHTGWCGGAIYFINHPYLPKTKYAAGITQSGAILEAKVKMGRIAYMSKHCTGRGGKGTWAARNVGCNSIQFNPGDGNEFIIWDPRQVVHVRIYKYL